MENPSTKLAYEHIREKILDGYYAPGFRLQTVELAKEIGVSRSPVRDALRQLEGEGLVETKHGLGASVRRVDAKKFREMCEVRLALESFTAELAARNGSPEDIVEIQDALQTMEALVAEMETSKASANLTQRLIEEDIRFHFAVLKAARNDLMRDEILRLHLLGRVVRMEFEKSRELLVPNPSPQARRRLVLESHRRIFEAIAARRPDAAKQAMYDHITEIVNASLLVMARLEKSRSLQGRALQDTRYAYDPEHPAESAAAP